MKRIITGIAITVALSAVIILGKLVGIIVPAVFFSLVILCAVIETRKALNERIPRCFNVFIYIFAALISLPAVISLFTDWDFFSVIFLALICSMLILCFIALFNNVKGGGLQNAFFLLLYPTLPLLSFIYMLSLSADENINLTALALAVTVSAMTDVFAYAFGKTLGKRKLCPKLSPNKTVEGAIGGVVGGLFAAAAVYVLIQVFNLVDLRLNIQSGELITAYILCGILGGAANQFGDLTASLVKRDCGIKDFGRILGSHGGVMDRFDGMMMCACITSVVFTFLIG